MISSLSEVRTTRYCIHPYFGFVCVPNAVLDFADTIPTPLEYQAIAHTDAWGFRNRDLPATKPPSETWIALFGGSVAFSVASSSNETTIAGYLEAELNRLVTNGRRVRVLNLALPAGQQPQALLIFTLRCGSLDGAVTFDGVNEVIIPAHYNREQIPSAFPYRPFYETLHTRSFTDEQRALQLMLEDEEASPAKIGGSVWRWWERPARERRLDKIRSALQGFKSGAVPLQSVFPTERGGTAAWIRAGVETWIDSAHTMHALARSKGIEMMSVLQPVPERIKPLTRRERAHIEPHPGILEIRAEGYRLLSERLATLRAQDMACEDFADVFANESGDVYVDLIHFNDRGCQVVARRLAGQIASSWRLPGFEHYHKG